MNMGKLLTAARIAHTDYNSPNTIMTTLHITVGDRKQLSEEALRLVQDAEVDDRSDRDDKTVIQSGSYRQ